MARIGRRNKGYTKVYTSLPPGTEANVTAEAIRRGLDKAAVIREALIEKFGLEATEDTVTSAREASFRMTGDETENRPSSRR